MASARSDIEWAWGKASLGNVLLRLNKLTGAIIAFTDIAERLQSATDTDRRSWHARSLVSKGVALGN